MKKYLVLATCCTMLLFACGQGGNNTASGTNTVSGSTSPGKSLFTSKCAVCHSLKNDRTGPKLEGAIARWNNDTVKLRAYIKNSQEFVRNGDPYVTALFKKWNSIAMQTFPDMSDAQVNDIIDYIAKGQE
ncbi:MAG: cytochrome c [Bacteroidota bacterium]